MYVERGIGKWEVGIRDRESGIVNRQPSKENGGMGEKEGSQRRQSDRKSKANQIRSDQIKSNQEGKEQKDKENEPSASASLRISF